MSGGRGGLWQGEGSVLDRGEAHRVVMLAVRSIQLTL